MLFCLRLLVVDRVPARVLVFAALYLLAKFSAAALVLKVRFVPPYEAWYPPLIRLIGITYSLYLAFVLRGFRNTVLGASVRRIRLLRVRCWRC